MYFYEPFQVANQLIQHNTLIKLHIIIVMKEICIACVFLF